MLSQYFSRPHLLISRRLFSTTRGPLSFEEAMKQQDLLVVDVTTVEEFAELKTKGVLPKHDLINIPVDDVPKRVDELGEVKDRPLLFYCKKGVRAGLAASFAQQKGYKNAFAVPDAQTVTRILNDFQKK